MSRVERPIFIIGVHRSGTTLLRYMLNSSPRIYIPPESDFIPYFFLRDPMAKLSEKRLAHILQTIFTRYRFVREWQGEPPDASAFLEAMPSRTPAGLLTALYRTYADQHGAVRWGDKTPIYTSYVDLIHRMFPQAQFVHIIRDGRDVGLSMLDKWGQKEFHIDLYFTARNWVKRIRQAQTAGARLGPNLYRELRYERLVQYSERELQSLCDFLGETYVPEMAQPHILGRERISAGGFSDPVRHPPNTRRVERWRQEMSAVDQRLFQRVTGTLLNELGYPIVDLGRMSPQEQARFAAMGVKYQALQTGRRVLQIMGLVPPI